MVAAATCVAAAGGAQFALTEPVTLPTGVSKHVFFVQAMLNARGPFWLTLDTGATHTVFDRATAGALGLPVRSAGARAGVALGAATTDLATTDPIDVRVGDLPAFRPRPTYILPVKAAETLLGHRIDGVLGTDYLSRHVLEIDGPRARARLLPPSTDEAAAGATLRLERNHLIATADLALPDGRTIEARLLVDSGHSGGFALHAPFVSAWRLDEVFPMVPGPSLNLRVTVGVGGAVSTSRVVTFESISVGGATLQKPDVALGSTAAGLEDSSSFDGLVGADILRRFRVVIDYPRRRIAFLR
jgi:hypothetical protein